MNPSMQFSEVEEQTAVLQDAIALIRKSITDFPLQFKNFRD